MTAPSTHNTYETEQAKRGWCLQCMFWVGTKIETKEQDVSRIYQHISVYIIGVCE